MMEAKLMIRILALVSCLLGNMSASVAADPAHLPDVLAAGDASVRELLRLMDKNKDGSVSKDEFMRFMSEEFDRLDADHSGDLSREELSSPCQAEGAQC
jgi:hypothetical protein